MKTYVISMAVGILVGVIYGLLHVRSPAPPTIALIGLLGMLLGEQIVPLATKLIKKEPISAAWVKEECLPKITGTAPSVAEKGMAAPDKPA
jgi:XapX domain-containing protein